MQIRSGRGDAVILAGSGNDDIWTGHGAQFTDAGDGNGTIWVGHGAQTVLGGAGDDAIYTRGERFNSPGRPLAFGEEGDDTIFAYGGGDTVFGGAGDTLLSYTRPSDTAPQFLDGGAGSDLFVAGHADATLTGGAGRDTFAFSVDADRRVVIADFRAGQDMVQFRAAPLWPWPPPVTPPDLTVSVAPGPAGGAVLHFGDGATVTLLDVPAARVAAHLGNYVKLG